jgi:hypothetical protein
MALYSSIFHLAQLLYVRLETFGPYHVHTTKKNSEATLFTSKEIILK